MNYLSAENISKSFGERVLFENINFGLNKGDMVALIAKNGAGKSTLMKMLAGQSSTDTGSIINRKGIKIRFLAQDTILDPGITIQELLKGLGGESNSISAVENSLDRVDLEDIELTEEYDFEIDSHEGEQARLHNLKMKQLLTLFGIHELNKKIGELSGGQKKRLAIVLAILEDPEVLLLDEPTNHLDIEMIEWLEKYLLRSSLTILMVTHDRYFLDRVCNRIIELDNKQFFYYEGNFEYFLRKKSDRVETDNMQYEETKRLYLKELDWIRRMPKARTTKSKSRIKDFDTIKERVEAKTYDSKL